LVNCELIILVSKVKTFLVLNKRAGISKSVLICTLAGTEILRNPQESWGIRSKYSSSCPPGIPAKNSCKIGKNRNYCDPLQNQVPVKKSSGKRRKKILRNPVRNAFLGPKN
jgi:hypothetical protein